MGMSDSRSALFCVLFVLYSNGVLMYTPRSEGFSKELDPKIYHVVD